MRAGRPRAGSRQWGGSAARRRRGAAAPAGHRPPARQRSSGVQPPPARPLTPHPSPPRRSRAAAHPGLGIQVGAVGDEVVEAVELAVVSRPHEGRPAELRRRGGGATR
eukprot:scaffold9492_cov33-Phaeocystis_antarctica.AAC.1